MNKRQLKIFETLSYGPMTWREINVELPRLRSQDFYNLVDEDHIREIGRIIGQGKMYEVTSDGWGAYDKAFKASWWGRLMEWLWP